MAATGKYQLAVLDYSTERARFEFKTDVLTNANWAQEATDRAAMKAAITVGQGGEPMVIGNLVQETVIVSHEELSTAVPTSKFAQRELKWRVQFEDDLTGDRHFREIPTADTTLLAANSDYADMADGNISAFVAAWEAVVIAPDTGNPVTVIDIRLVGRNI